MPDVDYIPLFALLGSQLTAADVSTIAKALASGSDQKSAEVIRAAMKPVTHEQPGEADIARVRTRLAGDSRQLAVRIA